jgi:hypothetical protein
VLLLPVHFGQNFAGEESVVVEVEFTNSGKRSNEAG